MACLVRAGFGPAVGSCPLTTIWQGTPVIAWFGSSKVSSELQDLERLGGDVEEDYWLRRPGGGGELHRYHERRVVKLTPVEYLREIPDGRAVLYRRHTPPVEMLVRDWESRRRFRSQTGLDLT